MAPSDPVNPDKRSNGTAASPVQKALMFSTCGHISAGKIQAPPFGFLAARQIASAAADRRPPGDCSASYQLASVGSGVCDIGVEGSKLADRTAAIATEPKTTGHARSPSGEGELL
jgi:hypothetical protein